MVYRITEEEIQKEGVEYRKNYPEFVPYRFTEQDGSRVAAAFANLITTQNGRDFDDYCVIDDNDKTQKYLTPWLKKGSKVLIHGVGTGREVVSAKEHGYEVIGITLGSRNMEFGRRYLGLAAGEMIECIAEALPFPAESFDVVAGYQIFEHALSPLMFLLEQSRVLKFGGRLVLEWPPADNYSMDENPHHQICYTPGQARALFQKAGYAKIKLFYSNMDPIPDEALWSGVSDKMLCIEGTKVDSGEQYIRRAWTLK